MKSTGVVRKIDDLGRIVIPKEIRKFLGIRDGENLEILIEDNNIKLIKKNIINNYLDNIKEIIEILNQIITENIIFTDREKIIACNNKELIKDGILLSDRLVNLLDARESFHENKLDEFIIGNNKLNGYFIIVPIINDGNPLGLVILYSKNKPVIDYYVLVKFISILLARKMDISC